jgi:Uma2 family endonuclease
VIAPGKSVPDVAVFLQDTAAVNHGAFWFGGPDFVVEIVSPDDQTREKLDFYAKVGVRELLLVDRSPWQLELYRLRGRKLEVHQAASPDAYSGVDIETCLLRAELHPSADRPKIIVSQVQGDKTWRI